MPYSGGTVCTLSPEAKTRYTKCMTNQETTVTINDLKTHAANQYQLKTDEVTATEAPNGGTAIWHSFKDSDAGVEDDFCLCWQTADGTVIWDEDPYGWNEVAAAAGY